MNRVILKISGEALKEDNIQVSKNKLKVVLETVKILKCLNKKVAIVIGGGNFFRGREHTDMNAVTGDTIGMLGTIMNALYVKDYLENNKIDCIIDTPFMFPDLIKNYSNDELKQIYDDGKVIIFGGGIGKSGYSTDSGTIHASKKIASELIIKMTNVDGVYDDDPKKNINAQKFDKLSYEEVIEKDLKVMDSYAVKECQIENIKILVINFNDYEQIKNYFEGKMIGTEIGD